MRAIVYTSNTGSTARYAKMLSQQIVIPAYNMEEAKEKQEKKTKYRRTFQCLFCRELLDDMLDMMRNGTDRVKVENLSEVITWYDTL